MDECCHRFSADKLLVLTVLTVLLISAARPTRHGYSPKQKHMVPGWNKDVSEKQKAARQAYLYWIENHKHKS